jgi:hypothetical protein
VRPINDVSFPSIFWPETSGSEQQRRITAKDWQKGITKFCDEVESVFRQRNIASHTPPVLQGGVWTFKPVAAAKSRRRDPQKGASRCVGVPDQWDGPDRLKGLACVGPRH